MKRIAGISAALLCAGATQVAPPRLAPPRPAASTETAAPNPPSIPAPPRLARNRLPPTYPPWMEVTDAAALDIAACRDRLSQTGARLLNQRRDSSVCGMSGGVEISQLGAASLRPVKVDCAFAEALDRWSVTANAAAQTHFAADIAQVLHFGGYSCRPVRADGFISAHSMGQALDVSGLALTNGARITVLNHWDSEGPEGALLKDLFAAACDIFKVSLSPEFNAAHADHFHFDIGDLRECL